jgi:hypothetical protein
MGMGTGISSEVLVEKWRVGVSFIPSFLKKKGKSTEEVKEELLLTIESLDRGTEATPEDQESIDVENTKKREGSNVISNKESVYRIPLGVITNIG